MKFSLFSSLKPEQQSVSVWRKLSIASLSDSPSGARPNYMLLVSRALRCLCPVVTVIFIIVMLASQSMSGQSILPVVRIDTSTVDLFAGLYSYFGENFDSAKSGDVALADSLSASALVALTNVTTSLMGTPADYLESTFFNTCNHTTLHYQYVDSGNSTDDGSGTDPSENPSAIQVHPYGGTEEGVYYNFTLTAIYCEPSTLLDYRSLLEKYGFGYVLVYGGIDASQDKDYAEYQRKINLRSKLLDAVPALLIFICIAQVPIILATVWYYYIEKKKSMQDPKLFIIRHFLAAWTLVIFIIGAYTCVSMTLVLTQMKKMMHNDVSKFGIGLVLCKKWFVMLWVLCGSMICTMSAWVGPTWCSADDDDFDDKNEGSQVLLLQRDGSYSEGTSLNNPFETDRDSFDDKTSPADVSSSKNFLSTRAESVYGKRESLFSTYLTKETTRGEIELLKKNSHFGP